MTLGEKVSQMVHEARGISRLGIPAYNWWMKTASAATYLGSSPSMPEDSSLMNGVRN